MQTLDEFNYYARLQAAPGLALVLFGSPACGACRAAERRLPALAPPGLTLFKVDVSVSQALARAFDLFHLPALMLYRDGRFHAPIQCVLSAPALAEAIAGALTAPAHEEP